MSSGPTSHSGGEPPSQVEEALWLPYYYAKLVHDRLAANGHLQSFPIGIEAISQAVQESSEIKNIVRKPVQSDRNIYGRFRRIHEPIANQPDTHLPVAEVAWETTADRNTRRLVICKELMHAFYSKKPINRTAGPAQMRALLEGLVDGSRATVMPKSPALEAESLALHTAIEVLCPFDKREEIIFHFREDYEIIPATKLADLFWIPAWALNQIFKKRFHDNARLGRGFIQF